MGLLSHVEVRERRAVHVAIEVVGVGHAACPAPKGGLTCLGEGREGLGQAMRSVLVLA